MEDQSEKEQLDAMRAWWSENGSFVIGGIVLGVIIIFGVTQWRNTIADAEIAASSLYEDLMLAADGGDLDEAEVVAAELFNEFEASPYAAQAGLAMARLYMDSARDQDAADALKRLIDANPDKELALVGRYRLAKILLYQGNAEEVVGLLRNQPDSAFSARMSEILGDAFFELEQYSEAEAAYLLALNDDPQVPTVDTSLLQLKINDLPGAIDADSQTDVDEPSTAEAQPVATGDTTADEPPADEATAETAAEGDSGNEQ